LVDQTKKKYLETVDSPAKRTIDPEDI